MSSTFAQHVNEGMKKFPGLRVQGYGLNRFGEKFVVSFVVALTLESPDFSIIGYVTGPEYRELLSRHVHAERVQKNVTRLLLDQKRLGAFMRTYLDRVDTSRIR